MNENRTERVMSMEQRFDRLIEWLGRDDALTDETKKDYMVLDEYYKTLWQSDYEADEMGELPRDMKRGVLSQDALYDVLTEFEERTNVLMTYEEAIEAVPPGRYRHFKGNEYEVIGIARHSETSEPMVVYRALYGDGSLWTRPAHMWNDTVIRDGRSFTRFVKE